MKALTLTQPWATLVIEGVKRWETRSWSTTYRGPLAIHAAKGYPREAREFADDLFQDELRLSNEVAMRLRFPDLGAILGTVELVAVHLAEMKHMEPDPFERTLGDYSPGRWVWELADPRPFPEPIPARGMLGLWEWAL